MDDIKFNKDFLNLEDKKAYDQLVNTKLPDISLLNQDGNLLKLKRTDTFRLVIYYYSLTGQPEQKLPKNWNNIPGANGCSLLNCNFRDNYESFIECNAIPIGVSTQSVDYIKEMTRRLMIPYDILSDINLLFVKKLNLPTFTINNQIYFKKFTMIVEKGMIKKVFYPVFSSNKHINEILAWLKKT